MNNSSSYSNFSIISNCICVEFLYMNVGQSVVRWSDFALFLPTVCFMLFMFMRLRRVFERLQRNRSPIFSAFFFLVFSAALVCTLRCVLAMSVPPKYVLVQKIAWLITRFTLLFVETSFIVFALIGSALENSSRTIVCVLAVTLSVTVTYSCAQSVLEIGHYYNDSFYTDMNNYDLYEHGGMLFWFISSTVLTICYAVILILGLLPRDKLCITLPKRKPFYWYVATIGWLNLVQAVGSGLLYFAYLVSALCAVELASFIYFILFNPLVYFVFLRGFFKSRAAITLGPRVTVTGSMNTTRTTSVENLSASRRSYQRLDDNTPDDALLNASLNDDELLQPTAMCDDDDEQFGPFDSNFYSTQSTNYQSIQSTAGPSGYTSGVARRSQMSEDATKIANEDSARPSQVEIVEPGAQRNASRTYATQQHAEFLAARSPHANAK